MDSNPPSQYIRDLYAAYEGRPTVQIKLAGVAYQVPEGVTLLMACWYAGIDLVKGAGCLGGVCGACTATCKVPDKANPWAAPKTVLGCQTTVEEGMEIILSPLDWPQKPTYKMAELDDPAEALFTIYPETRRCTNCDACTMVCPQDIPVRAAMRKMMNKQFDEVAPAFDECVMCGFCTMVCEVAIAPNLLGIYARKAVTKDHPTPVELQAAQTTVESGVLNDDWAVLMSGNAEAVAAHCQALRDADG